MNAVDLPFAEAIDLFETGGTKGMSKDSVDKIPKVSVTAENNVDDSGEKICCSVCLQVHTFLRNQGSLCFVYFVDCF